MRGERMGTEPIKWTTEKRRLGDLIKWEPNPRQLTKDQAKRLNESILEFGYSQLYEIEPDNTIIDGHQRDEVMLRMDKFGPEAKIEVRVSSRKLTLEERKKYIAMKHRGAMGEWNNDLMLNLYDPDELLEWGFDTLDLLKFGYQYEDIDYDQLWQGMPEFEQDNIEKYKEIKISFLTEDDYREFSKLINQNLTDKTKSIWFPEQYFNQTGKGLVYSDEE